MVRPGFVKRLPSVVSVMLLLLCAVLSGAICREAGAGAADDHVRQGMEYFNKGFYTHAPKGEAAEANKNYDAAVGEFKAAIAEDGANAEAHRKLARVYFVEKKFEAAAEEYRNVAELAPADLDAYVNLALSLIELKEPASAIQALEDAKRHTYDPKALETLDSYIGKIRDYQEKGVR